MVCITLRTGDCDDYVKQAVATKLIALAKAGERNPDRLCEEAVKDIRRPQQWAASEAAKSSGFLRHCSCRRARACVFGSTLLIPLGSRDRTLLVKLKVTLWPVPGRIPIT